MIFVTLGTQDKAFPRLLRVLDKHIKSGLIQDKVVVQAGYTDYQSEKMEIFDSLPKEEFESYIEKADLVITHGGVGSILDAISRGKVVIAAPRLSKYKEHTNDHQKQIVNEFAKEGYILALKDFSKFEKVYEKSKKFQPKVYHSQQAAFCQLIKNYIDTTAHISWYHRDFRVIFASIINMFIFCGFWLLELPLYIGVMVSYMVSCLLLYLLNSRKLRRPLLLLIGFFWLDLACFYLLEAQWGFPVVLAKLVSDLVLIILYHFIDKRND